MKKIILFICLVVLFITPGKAQVNYSVQNMTFSLPSSTIKIAKSNLAPYSEVQQGVAHLPNIYKINDIYLGFTNLKETKRNIDSIQKYKLFDDLQMKFDIETESVYYSKIETINNNIVYLKYIAFDDIGDNHRYIGKYYITIYNFEIKKVFLGSVAFENQSNYAAATTILYNFLNTVSFPLYVNNLQSFVYRKSCDSPTGVGSLETSRAEAGEYSSRISQADADAQAIEAATRNGQFYANTVGTCTYFNTVKSGSFTKNNCATGGVGSAVTYKVDAGKYSAENQFNADKNATDDIIANGQIYANANGVCLFKSKALTEVPFRKKCTAPKVGTYVNYSAVAGAFTSYTSQADADLKAQTAGQNNANLKGICR